MSEVPRDYRSLVAAPLQHVDDFPPAALVVIASVFVQCGATLATKLFNTVGPGGAVVLREVMACLIISAVVRPNLRGVARDQWVAALTFGVALAGLSLCFYNAISRIPLGLTVTIQFLGPLLVATMRSRRRSDLLFVAIALCGVLALARGTTETLDPVGVGLAVATAVMFSAFVILGKRVSHAFAGGDGLAIALGFAAVLALPFGLADGGSEILTWRSLALGLGVGALSTAVPYACEIAALRRVGVTTFGVLVSLQPAVAAVAGFAFLNQDLSFRAGIGVALVVVASAGVSLTAGAAGGSGGPSNTS